NLLNNRQCFRQAYRRDSEPRPTCKRLPSSDQHLEARLPSGTSDSKINFDAVYMLISFWGAVSSAHGATCHESPTKSMQRPIVSEGLVAGGPVLSHRS